MGYKVIFKTGNNVQLMARWRLEKTGSGDGLICHGVGGICVPMVAKWMQRSIPLGYRGVRYASELRLGARDFRFQSELHSQCLMGIITSAFSVQKSAFGANSSKPFQYTTALFNIYNLFIKSHLAEGSFFLDLTEVFEKVCSMYGHFALTFIDISPDNSSGHTIGFRHDYQVFQMFDPNVGLIEYPDEKSFRKEVQIIFLTNECYYRYIRCNKYVYWTLLEMEKKTFVEFKVP